MVYCTFRRLSTLTTSLFETGCIKQLSSFFAKSRMKMYFHALTFICCFLYSINHQFLTVFLNLFVLFYLLCMLKSRTIKYMDQITAFNGVTIKFQFSWKMLSIFFLDVIHIINPCSKEIISWWNLGAMASWWNRYYNNLTAKHIYSRVNSSKHNEERW